MEFLLKSTFLTATCIFIYILSRILKFHFREYAFANPKKSGLYALGAVFSGWSIITLLILYLVKVKGQGQNISAYPEYNLSSIVNLLPSSLFLCAPVIFMMLRKKETMESVYISRHNFAAALLIGLLVSLGYISFSIISGNHNSIKDVILGLNRNHLWALVYFSIVGFYEEFLFRGYLQSRMIGWLGKVPGLLLTSVLMALSHYPLRIGMGLSYSEAMLSSLSLVPLSLLLGFTMIRTENLIAPGLVHTFANWVNTI